MHGWPIHEAAGEQPDPERDVPDRRVRTDNAGIVNLSGRGMLVVSVAPQLG
jgi:hypothetical protein